MHVAPHASASLASVLPALSRSLRMEKLQFPPRKATAEGADPAATRPPGRSEQPRRQEAWIRLQRAALSALLGGGGATHLAGGRALYLRGGHGAGGPQRRARPQASRAGQ